MERLVDISRGFPVYVGKQNPFDVGLITGEIASSHMGNYSPKEIVVEVFNKLAAYEDLDRTPEELVQDLAELATLRKLAGKMSVIDVVDLAKSNGKLMSRADKAESELTTLKQQIADGAYVKVVRCQDCFKRCTPMCAVRHERADMDYCSTGERRDV